MEISGKKSFILIFITSVILFFLLYLIAGAVFQNKSYNFMVELATGSKKADNQAVLVVIDNKSLSEIGRWPWTRDKTVSIFDFLEYYTNAKVIAYDAVIIAPDKENPEADRYFFDSIKKYKKLIAGVGFLKEDFDTGINADEYNQILKDKANLTVNDKRKQKENANVFYNSFTPFVKEYFKNINHLGVVNSFQDSDGYTRKIDQLVNYKGKFYPSLGLAAYSKYTGIKDFTLDDFFLSGKNKKFTLHVPVENMYDSIYSYISFYKTKDRIYSHEIISASDVINSLELIKQGKKPILDPEIFNGKVVFVGAYANAQALTDMKMTPISDTLAGVEIQATNFNNLLDNRFYVRVSKKYEFFVTLFMFVLVASFVTMLPVFAAFLCIAAAMLFYFLFVFLLYTNYISISLILPEIFMLFAIGYGYSFKYLMEGRKKEKIESAMSKYISKDVMKDVVKNIDSIKLGGKRAEVTVLFADIRGFTSISENLSAVEVTNILNEYFSVMVPIIESHKGVLNKFMGDAVLAIFGEPIKNEKHAIDAVKCAWEMLKKVRILQEKWIQEGKPKIEIGIGISSGEVFIGNIGTEDRLEYTVIGDTVNTASRIENYNKVYRTNFLISEQTYLRVQKQVDVIKIREVSIRGKSKRINIYEVLRILED